MGSAYRRELIRAPPAKRRNRQPLWWAHNQRTQLHTSLKRSSCDASLTALLRSVLTGCETQILKKLQFLPGANNPVPQRTWGGNERVTVFKEKTQSRLRSELRSSEPAPIILGTASQLNFAAGPVSEMNQAGTWIQICYFAHLPFWEQQFIQE